MLDWWTGKVDLDASFLDTGRTAVFAPGGKEEGSSARWRSVRGSHEDSIQLRACSTPQEFPRIGLVYGMSGNPTKFLQGHNCFGPPVAQLNEVIAGVLREFPEEYRPRDYGFGELEGPLHLHSSRLDVTTMIDMGSQYVVKEWLAHAGTKTRSRHGRPLTSGSTVMWGNRKSPWQLKGYNKFLEVQKNPPYLVDFRPSIDDYIEPMLRLELRLGRKEIVKLQKEQIPITEDLIWTYFDRVEIGIMKTDGMRALADLPASSRQIAQLWLDGHPVKEEMNIKTFYRHRRRILDQTGLDISGDASKADDGYPRGEFAQEYLRAHEVREVPEVFNRWLWRPQGGRDYRVGKN